MRRFGLTIVLVMLLILTFNLPSIESWVYNDGTLKDARYERFGPRADRLLIKLYENETSVWDALARGEIDITDWPLSRAYYDLFTNGTINPVTGQPYNETINTVSHGSELDLIILDVNNNNNEYLGNPPDPAYLNPVYPNPTSVKEMRQAIAHLVDRSQLDTIIGVGFYDPLYTIIPHQGYNHLDIRPGRAFENITYPYSRAAAEALLDAGGFPANPTTDWRFWDRNNDGVEQTDEYLELKFPMRTDDERRLAFANFLADELNAVGVRVFRMWLGPVDIFQNVMLEKNFHLYTGGWQLGVSPNHLILWCWHYYWHPGFCYNYAGVKDEEFCEDAIGVIDARSMEEALENASLAQVIFAENAYGVPLWSYAGSKAISRFYTGGNAWQSVRPDDGENQYRGQYWEGTVNMPAIGIDNFWSFLNMKPQGHTRGDGENMIIRWGFKTTELKMLNPVSAEWIWEWNVLGLIYEPLIKRNPYNLAEFIPWLAEDLQIDTYNHPFHGECTKIRLKLRPDITWHDGTPLTTADVHFTWVELDELLREQGIPPPWWCYWEEMVDIKLLDGYNFELLFDQQDIWLWNWASSTIILPKHIWKPLIETSPSDVMSGFAPDPNLIGSGPWRLKEYVEDSHVLLVANSPDSTVQTNLPNSTPITSSKGYCRYLPVVAEAIMDGTTEVKIDHYTNHTLDYTIYNLYDESIMIDVNISYPDGAEYGEKGVEIQAAGNWTHSWTGDVQHTNKTDMLINVFSPAELSGLHYWSQIYYGTLVSYNTIYPTLMMITDIAGSTFHDDIGLIDYPFKSQLPTPDIKIDIRDISVVARAFGSYPDHERWEMGIADINNDYKINIRDISAIAMNFGWTG